MIFILWPKVNPIQLISRYEDNGPQSIWEGRMKQTLCLDFGHKAIGSGKEYGRKQSSQGIQTAPMRMCSQLSVREQKQRSVLPK